MARKPKTKLCAAPTGYELLDLVWAHQSNWASAVLDALPQDVDPVWATVAGMRDYQAVQQALDQAMDELERTPETSALRRLRERQVRHLDEKALECAGLLLAALAAVARASHRRASPRQVWMLVFEGLKMLVNDMPYEAETGNQPESATALEQAV